MPKAIGIAGAVERALASVNVPGFESRSRHHMGVKFVVVVVVVFHPWPEGFPHSSKTNISNSNV